MLTAKGMLFHKGALSSDGCNTLYSVICASGVFSWHMGSNETALWFETPEKSPQTSLNSLEGNKYARRDILARFIHVTRTSLVLLNLSDVFYCCLFTHAFYLFICKLCSTWFFRFSRTHPDVSRIHFLFINICFLYQYAKTFINDQYVQISFSQPFI